MVMCSMHTCVSFACQSLGFTCHIKNLTIQSEISVYAILLTTAYIWIPSKFFWCNHFPLFFLWLGKWSHTAGFWYGTKLDSICTIYCSQMYKNVGTQVHANRTSHSMLCNMVIHSHLEDRWYQGSTPLSLVISAKRDSCNSLWPFVHRPKLIL